MYSLETDLSTSPEADFSKRRKPKILACFLDCFLNCCLFSCIETKRKRNQGSSGSGSKQQSRHPTPLINYGGGGTDEEDFSVDSIDFSDEEVKVPGIGRLKAPGGGGEKELCRICSRCSTRYSQISSTKADDFDLDVEDDEVFQKSVSKSARSLSTPSPIANGLVSLPKCTKKSAGDVPGEMMMGSRLAIISSFRPRDNGSKPTSSTSCNSVTPTSGMMTFRPIHRSPSNYCRVATCEQLHIHELTPKCLETFAPSSTCSSCQTCDRQHIGPNHDQVLLVSQLVKNISPLPCDHRNGFDLTSPGPTVKHHTSSLLMQWPLPEYRPQHSPNHLYRSFGF